MLHSFSFLPSTVARHKFTRTEYSSISAPGALITHSPRKMTHIKIRRIPVESAQEIVGFINSDFDKSEPLCEYLGSLKSVFNDVIVLRTVQLGMSFEAIDTTKNDQRVGVFLTAPAAKGVTSELDLELEQLEIDDQMEKIGGFLDYAKSIVEPMMKSDVYLEGVIMSVLPGYGGQGIGKRLLHAVEEMAVEMGLPLIYVGCTSEYSARVVAKCGFQEVYHLRYDAYLKEGVQVFDPRPPHDTFRAYIKLLG